MEESLELWVGTSLVVDEFDFDSLHGRDGEDGLRHTGTQTAQQPAARSQVSSFVFHLVLEGFKRPKSETAKLDILDS